MVINNLITVVYNELLLIKGVIMNIGELCNRETIIVLKDENIGEAANLMRHYLHGYFTHTELNHI